MPQHVRHFKFIALLLAVVSAVSFATAAERDAKDKPRRFELADVFQLEYAADPQISPDGRHVVYVRNSFDIMTDRTRSRLWIARTDLDEHLPLTDPEIDASSPRWSPDGKRIAYVAKFEKHAQIFVRWVETAQVAKLTQVTESPRELSWSPDGRMLAFSMLVPTMRKPYVELPAKPEGAEWAKPFKLIDTLVYRDDGKGYVKEGFHHLFTLTAEGGTPWQVTSGDYHHADRPVWSADGKSLFFAANRQSDWEHQPLDSEIFELTLADGTLRQVTDRRGADHDLALSPDGKQLAWTGFDDVARSYHQSDLYLMSTTGQGRKCLTTEFDRDVTHPHFSHDGQGIFFQYDDQGNTKVGYLTLATGKIETVIEHIGGTTLDRPSASGSCSLSGTGQVAATVTTPERPADVAVVSGRKGQPRMLTRLNDDLLSHRELGTTEEYWFKSSHDDRKIHGWIVKPPRFDPRQKYPLILEIHGGPFANYGDRFAADMQLFAAAGYVVVYVNCRGSTSYGDKFTGLIDHNYPSEDYDDLMSGVDAIVAQGYVDPQRLYVTGGSGGGVLSSWIVGKTNRFQAAAVIKPVVNWYSFALTSDHYNFFARYWFGKHPWEDPQPYLKRSPLSLVGNVTTPTMLMTGEEDYRTPISESEQFYQALKLRKIDTVLVRVPGAAHNIAARPSQLIAHAAYVLKWFETHPGKDKKVESK